MVACVAPGSIDSRISTIEWEKIPTDRVIYRNGKSIPDGRGNSKLRIIEETYATISCELITPETRRHLRLSAFGIETVERHDVPISYVIAEKDCREGAYEEALRKFETLASEPWRNWVAQYSLFHAAECLLKLDRVDEGLSTFKELLLHVPESRLFPEVHARMGECYLRMDDRISAAEEFELLHRLAASSMIDRVYEPVAEMYVAATRSKGSLTDRSARSLDELMARVSEGNRLILGETLLRIGDAYMSLDEYEMAREFYARAESIAQHSLPGVLFRAWIGQGRSCLYQGKYHEGLRKYLERVIEEEESAFELRPVERAEAVFLAARCLFLLRDECAQNGFRAWELYREVVKIAPRSRYARLVYR